MVFPEKIIIIRFFVNYNMRTIQLQAVNNNAEVFIGVAKDMRHANILY